MKDWWISHKVLRMDRARKQQTHGSPNPCCANYKHFGTFHHNFSTQSSPNPWCEKRYHITLFETPCFTAFSPKARSSLCYWSRSEQGVPGKATSDRRLNDKMPWMASRTIFTKTKTLYITSYIWMPSINQVSTWISNIYTFSCCSHTISVVSGSWKIHVF